MDKNQPDPIIELAIDNCFASKRWTQPADWCALIKDLGISCIEASADTECDPLYTDRAYIHRWTQQVQEACAKNGTRIVNLYSGHGTYSTLGLSHWDERVRRRFRDRWIKEHANTAQALGAGLGFFAHAFDESVLQDPGLYGQVLETLFADLADIAVHCTAIGMDYAGVEQMYSPHQVPWTIAGAKQMLRRIYEIGKAPFYITDDVGHMSGQQYFQRPTEKYILDCFRDPKKPRIFMGSKASMDCFRSAVRGEISEAVAVDRILADADRHPYLFADTRDGDPYAWLEETACYSPIIHLQQSDGKSSPHWSFDEAHNQKGIIDGEKVLRAIAQSYVNPEEAGLPPRCEKIVLTLEPFIGTAGNIYDAVAELQASAAYWRRFIPQDGMHLSELLAILPSI